MSEERISQILRELPRANASPRFTADVMRRLRQGEQQRSETSRRAWIPRLALAASLAVAVIAVVAGLARWSVEQERRAERRAALVRLEALEAQEQALKAQVLRLRRLTRDAQPVVYLGSTPKMDVVVDLRHLAQRRAATIRPGAVVPASTRSVSHQGDNPNAYIPVRGVRNRGERR